MTDNLKDFIEKNRGELDGYEPGDHLWGRINERIKQGGKSKASGNNNSNWWRYGGLGASVIIAAVILYTAYQNNTNPAQETTNFNKETAVVESSGKPEKVIPPVTDDSSITIADDIMEGENPDHLSSSNNEPMIKALEDKPGGIQNEDIPKGTNIATGTATMEAPDSEEKISSTSEIISVPKMGNKNFKIKSTTESGKGEFYTSIDTLFYGINRIEVEGGFCNVVLNTHTEDNLRISGEIKTEARGLFSNKNKEYQIISEKKGSLLKVYIENSGGSNATFIIGSFTVTASLNFVVPEATDVVIKNSSGDITASSIKGKQVELETSSGNIKVVNTATDLSLLAYSGGISTKATDGNINAETSSGNQQHDIVRGSLNAKAFSGDIVSKEIQGDVKAETSSGNQQHDNVQGHFTGRSYSGDISVSGPKGDVDVKSSSGNQVYKNIMGNIVADAYSGNIDVYDSKAKLIVKTSSGNITGENVEVIAGAEFETYSGDIEMSLKNEIKDLSFEIETYSGHSKIKWGDSFLKGEGKLTLHGGDILITGVTSSGNQIYKKY